MADLQQRTPAWFAARRGKLTCSNLGGILGQVGYVSRIQAYRRCLGTEKFQGNPACTSGNDNEQNGIVEYMAKTGNVVKATGLHVRPQYNWLAGSPDGLVGDEGMIEVKSPYYHKRDGSSRVHSKVPGHYWMQINCLLEITGRQWCDYVCWTPEATTIYRVYRDPETFEFLCSYYSAVYAALRALCDEPPPLDVNEKKQITARIDAAMERGVDLLFWRADILSTPPKREDSDPHTEDGNALSPTKRRRVSSPQSATGEACDGADACISTTVCAEDPTG